MVTQEELARKAGESISRMMSSIHKHLLDEKDITQELVETLERTEFEVQTLLEYGELK